MMQPARTDSLPAADRAVWLTSAALALCLFGLVHDTSYLGAEQTSAERHENIEQEEKFRQSVDAAPIQRKAGFLGMLGVATLCLLQRPAGVRLRWGVLGALVLLSLAWAAASYRWSTERNETARGLVRLSAYAAVGAALARRFDAHQLCLVLAGALAVSVALAVGAEVLTANFRPWIPDYRIRGTLHANVLARQALLAAIAGAALWIYARDTGPWKLVTLAMVAVLMLTRSRTGAVTFVVALATLPLLGASLRSLTLTTCAALGLAGAALLGSTFGGAWLQRQAAGAAPLGRNEDVTSLAGRIPLWMSIWKEARTQSMRGFGYGAFWLPEKTQDIGEELKWYPRHAHSAYVEIMVNLGFVGLVLVVATAVCGAVRAGQLAGATGLGEYRVFGAWLIAGLGNGVAEAAFVLPR
ncbi:MAG TPA: O-antigen ligase family protein, partial [Lacipirellulaceae bacterium]|nr:O-antigen ligase family protein [Lacipirellulaceae bacterium]